MSTVLSRRSLLAGLVALPTAAVADCPTCRIVMGDAWQPPATPQQTESRPSPPAPQAEVQPAAPAVQNRAVIQANELRLRIHQANGGWNYDDVIWAQGRLDSRALNDLSHFMRDWRDGYTLPFSPTTALVLARAQLQAGGRLLGVYSGTRSRSTNDMLRARSSGVAANSLHLSGRAADTFIEGLSMQQTASLYRANGGGGVSVYDDFTHIDDGPRRTW